MLQGGENEVLEKYHLAEYAKKNMQKLKYVNQSKCYSSPNIDDQKEFTELLSSMEVLGFSGIKDTIFSITAAVLLLGNITFDDTNHNHSGKN